MLLFAAAAVAAVLTWVGLLQVQLAPFRRLAPGMHLQEVVARCGRPDRSSGSGILRYHYRLVDGSEVTVVYSGLFVAAVSHRDRELMDARLVAERDELRRRERERYETMTRTSATYPVSIAAPDSSLQVEHLRRSRAAIPATTAPPR